MLNLPTEVFGDVLVVHAPDELNEERAGEFLRFAANHERINVVVDLDDVETIDSAGLTALLDLQDALRERHGDVKLIAANPINRKILDITRLDDQLDVFESVIDAVKSFV